MDWLFDPQIWIALITLTALEIVLGIDNIVVLAIISNNLPLHQREKARYIGLSLALLMRLALLFAISWIAGLIHPIFTIYGHPFSGRDLLLLAGGLFLMYKAVHEIHVTVEEAGSDSSHRPVTSFANAIVQIVILDLVFSFDSVITAVGMAREFWVMVAAVVIAVLVMLAASGPIVRFIHAHPTVKMLALSFVLLIGTALVAEGFEFEIPKGYLYFAMAFSVLVESLNVAVSRRRKRHANRPS
jgi:predicted tellurium resistance membrane protein TerC